MGRSLPYLTESPKSCEAEGRNSVPGRTLDSSFFILAIPVWLDRLEKSMDESAAVPSEPAPLKVVVRSAAELVFILAGLSELTRFAMGRGALPAFEPYVAAVFSPPSIIRSAPVVKSELI